MKKILISLNLALVAAVVAATLVFMREHARVCHERDELADDKAALLLERSEVSDELAKAQKELEKVREDKSALGRSLVKAMDSCTRLQEELKKQQTSLDQSAIDQAVQRQVAKLEAERERQAREKERLAKEKERLAQEKARRAKELAEKAKVEAERLARERAPLKVDELKPLDPKAKAKSDKESLDELLELTTKRK